MIEAVAINDCGGVGSVIKCIYGMGFTSTLTSELDNASLPPWQS